VHKRLDPPSASVPRIAGSPAQAWVKEATGFPLRIARRRFVETFEIYYLRAQLRRHGGNLESTALHAGITEKRLRELLRLHGIERQGVQPPLRRAERRGR
jgi:DNA-binding NtrC family response regulator